MKKTSFALSLIASLIMLPAHAITPKQHSNTCIEHIDEHVDQISDEFGMLTLTECKLADNDMRDVVSYIEKHPELRWLNLYGNDIGPIGALTLSSLHSLDSLVISDNHIESAGAIALSTIPTLKMLSAFSNGIDDQGAVALANMTNLKELSLVNNPVGKKGINALAHNKTLHGLAIGTLKDIDSKSIAAITQNKTLIELDLYYSNIGANEARMIAKMPKLKSLAINYSNLGDDGVIALSTSKTIEQLSLNQANVGRLGAVALAQMTSLKGISILNWDSSYNYPNFRNHIDDLSVIAIASNNNLSYIILENLELGDTSATALAQNARLQIVSLSKNKISDSGAIAFAQSKLGYLNLAHNLIGKIGINILANNPNIDYLDTSDNPGSESGKPSLKKHHGKLNQHEIDQAIALNKLKQISKLSFSG